MPLETRQEFSTTIRTVELVEENGRICTSSVTEEEEVSAKHCSEELWTPQANWGSPLAFWQPSWGQPAFVDEVEMK